MSEITGKNIWITGASSGIGRELALQLAEFNTHLILSSRNTKSLARIASQCTAKGATVTLLPVDLLNTNEISAIDESMIQYVDILVHSAGVSQRSMAIDTSIDVDRHLMEINFFASVALSKRVLRNMCRRKNGHIVIVSSAVGKFGTPMRSGYSASKHAIHGYFDSLRAELHREGINVSLVCPGYIKTDITLKSLTGNGTPYNRIDQDLAHGISVEHCAQRIIKGILRNESEFTVCGIKEYSAILLKRFFPVFFSLVIRNVNAVK